MCTCCSYLCAARVPCWQGLRTSDFATLLTVWGLVLYSSVPSGKNLQHRVRDNSMTASRRVLLQRVLCLRHALGETPYQLLLLHIRDC